MSRFVILAERCDEPGSDLKHETSQTVKQAPEEADGEDRKVESLLDFDGDLDIIHRYAKTFPQSTIKSCWLLGEGVIQVKTINILFQHLQIVLLMCSLSLCRAQKTLQR